MIWETKFGTRGVWFECFGYIFARMSMAATIWKSGLIEWMQLHFFFFQSSKKFPLFGILCLSISRRTKRNFWLRGKKKVFDKMFDEKLLFTDFLWLAKPLKKLSGLFFGWGSLFDQTTNFCGDSLRLSFAWLRYGRISRSNWFSNCGGEILFRLSERGRALNLGLRAHLVLTFWHIYSIKNDHYFKCDADVLLIGLVMDLVKKWAFLFAIF